MQPTRGSIQVSMKEESDALRGFLVRLEPMNYALRAALTHSVKGLRDLRVVGQALDCVANDHNARLIQEVAQAHEYSIEFKDPTTELVFTKCLMQGISRHLAAEAYAGWRAGLIDDKMADVESPTGQFELAPYQRAAVAISRMAKDYALFMEQGTGKTPVVVSRVNTDARELKENRMLRVLVLCPKQLRTNWKNEFANFSTLPGKVTVFRDSMVKRVRAIIGAMTQENGERFTVVIASFGLMVQSWDSVLKHVPWDLVVIDESQGIKAPGAQRTKVAMHVRDRSTARMVLTGTPIINGVMDLYSQLEFLGEGTSNYRSAHAYKGRFHTIERQGGYAVATASAENIPEIKERLAQVSFQVRKEEVLKDLPPKQYDVLEVEMTERQQADYDALATQLALEIESALAKAELDNRRELVVNNAFVKLMKLAQITSGFLVLNEERDADGDVVHEHEVIFYPDNPKLEQLMEEVKALPQDEKMIVWSSWVPAIKQIAARFKADGIEHELFYGLTSEADRERAVHRFNNDPTCRFLIGNPAAGGAGLNLLGYDYASEPPTQGTDCTCQIYFAQSHKPAERWQSEDRPHRRGTRRPVRTRDLVVPDSIDEEIRIRVTQKKKHALEVQDLREILNSILEKLKERR